MGEATDLTMANTTSVLQSQADNNADETDTAWIPAVIEGARNRFDYLRFTFGDIHGISRSKVVARRHFHKFMKDGVALYARAVCFGPRSEVAQIQELVDINMGNIVVRPMPGTIHALPWAADGRYRMGEIFCEAFWIPPYRNGVHLEACPRYMARKQLGRLRELGYRLFSGIEAEFIACRNDNNEPLFTGLDLYSNLVISEIDGFMCEMDEKLAAAGVNTTHFHAEYGDGQFEFATAATFGIGAADQMFLLKESVKEMCWKHGWKSTFMSTPILGTSSNGQHFSHSIWSRTSCENVFYDPTKPDTLSDIGRHWIAGLLKHGPALSAICSPTVNCYRRLHTSFVPDYVDWGYENRTAMIRAKTGDPSATYLENRLPSGSANPYLVLAATVAAGIDGLVNRLDCPAPVSVETAPESKKTNSRLPNSLSEALNALEADKVLCEALGEEFVRWFVTIKRDVEISKVSKAAETGHRQIDVERELYFKFL